MATAVHWPCSSLEIYWHQPSNSLMAKLQNSSVIPFGGVDNEHGLILFSHHKEIGTSPGWINFFSVPSSDKNQASLKSHAIIWYVGRDDRDGGWWCSRDSGQHCAHTAACYLLLMLGDGTGHGKIWNASESHDLPKIRFLTLLGKPMTMVLRPG